MKLLKRTEIFEPTDVYCGTVHSDSHMMFVSGDGNLFAAVHNCLSLESAGAQAFSSFDTYLAPYIKYEGLTREQVYQELQSYVFSANISSRWGSQPVFSNITLDWTVPLDMAETYCWIGNKQVDFKYKDCQKEMDMINDILIDLFMKGDANGRSHAYPIPTYSITKDFDWDSPLAEKLFELTCKYGVPYFQNFINSDLNPTDVRSMCPIPGDVKIKIRASMDTEPFLIPIGDIDLKEFYVPFGSEWKKATHVKAPVTDVYSFTLADNSSVRFGRDHEHPVIRKESYVVVKAKDVQVGDYFIYEDDNGQFLKKVTNIVSYPNDKPLYCVAISEDQGLKLDYLLDSIYEDTTHLFTLPNGLITKNCRLRLNLRELMHRGGGLFGSGEKTGSIGVVTINLPQLGYLYKDDKKKFYEELDRLLVLAKDSLVLKRKTIEELMAGGFYPYSKVYVENYDTFFNTIGINGCNECIRNFTNDKHNIADEWGQAFTNELLDYINSRLSDFQEETGLLFNLEATPAEGTGYRFALHDKKNYPDIITANDNGDPYYTNSTWLPATYTDDIFEALDIQDQFQTKYTGGTVFHAYLGERVHDWKACAELIKSIFTNYRLPYLTISPTFSVCPKHGYLDGEQKYCPRCRDEQLREIDQKIEDIQKELEVADDEN
jgi:ribonucleoside-triphosphate reductase